MEFLSPEFPWGHSQDPLHYLCSSPFCPLFPSSISTPLWPQSSLTRLCSSLGLLPSSEGTSQLLNISSQVPRVPF